MKVFGLFNMFACYACTVLCVCTTVHMIAFANEYVQAFFMASAGGAMFIIARTLHNEWRQGKL